MILHIKYMASMRCKMMVAQELKKLGLRYVEVELGTVDVIDDIPPPKLNTLKTNLSKIGLEILEDNKSILIEKVKVLIIELIHQADALPAIKYSDYISENLNLDYTYVSNLFSEVKGMTIQQFIINNRIERVKELIMYDNLSITDIADKLQYSSVAHLSNQFKKITGMTPTDFKKLKKRRRVAHENI